MLQFEVEGALTVKKTQPNSKNEIKVVQPTYPDYENSWMFEDLDRASTPKSTASKIQS